jgi:hypothetical protein
MEAPKDERRSDFSLERLRPFVKVIEDALRG